MYLITVLQILPVTKEVEFEHLEGRHFIWLLIFMFLINLVYFGYRVYKTHVENKKFSSIYEFISNQNEMNKNWDNYIKGLTERFIREAPPDQIRVVAKLIIKEGFCQIISSTDKLIRLNGIANRTLTDAKIKLFVSNVYDDMKINFDLFMYNGRKLGVYLCKSWVHEIVERVTDCVYGDQNIDILSRSLDEFSKQVKLDFYHRMTGKRYDDED